MKRFNAVSLFANVGVAEAYLSETGINVARHQNGEGCKLVGFYKMLKSRRRKGKIDEEIHPVDVGVGYKSITAIGIHNPHHDTKIIGNTVK